MEELKVPPPENDPSNAGIKTGYASSEFFLSVLAVAVGVLLQSGLLAEVGAPPWVGTLAGAFLQVITILGYGAMRTSQKNESNRTAGLVALGELSTLQRTTSAKL